MNTPPMNDLDNLLARSAPPSADDAPELDSAIRLLTHEATTAPPRRSPWQRRAALAVGALAVIGVGGAGAVAVLPDRPVVENPLMEPSEEWASVATNIEWIYTDPDGYRCVMRLTGFELTEAQKTEIRARLSDPGALLAADDGAVRDELMTRFADDEGKQDIADRATWESWIDAAYDEVSELDISAGTTELDGTPMTRALGTAEGETFNHAYMRVILDGLTSDAVDPLRDLIPDSACEVGE